MINRFKDWLEYMLCWNMHDNAPCRVCSKWTCEALTGDRDVQPTAKQVSKLTASVAAYDK